MPNKEELLQSIHPDMKLNKAFFLKIYGYEITWPGFAESAIKILENAGCNNARRYYEQVLEEYLAMQKEKWNKYRRKQGDELRVEKYSSSLQQKNYSKKQRENSVAKLNRLKALI